MVCQMQDEMQVALNFILSYLYNKLPRTRVHLYGEELELAIKKKFESHWYPKEPNKGSAYRCIHINHVEIDPAFEIAAVRSGLDFHNDIKAHLPNPLSVWVDPGEVSYTISAGDGKTGAVKILYKRSLAAKQGNEFSDVPVSFQQHEGLKFGFNPNAKDFLPKSPSNQHLVSNNDALFFADSSMNMGFNNRPQKRLYTVDEFASTKFGSTKMKNCPAYTESPRNQPPCPNSTNNRPHSLGFAPMWDFNSTYSSSGEFPEVDFPRAGNKRFHSKSSYDSSSSSSSSSDNLNSPTKFQYGENTQTLWSPGSEFPEQNEEFVFNNMKNMEQKNNENSSCFFAFNEGEVFCQ